MSDITLLSSGVSIVLLILMSLSMATKKCNGQDIKDIMLGTIVIIISWILGFVTGYF